MVLQNIGIVLSVGFKAFIIRLCLVPADSEVASHLVYKKIEKNRDELSYVHV